MRWFDSKAEESLEGRNTVWSVVKQDQSIVVVTVSPTNFSASNVLSLYTNTIRCTELRSVSSRPPTWWYSYAIQIWTPPGFFQPTSLHLLGLRIQLGHPVGKRCPAPLPATNFTILDTYAIHEVSLDFCGCETATNTINQLLRARLYPATMKHPRTAATFNLLKRYELLSFESKCSAYQYYQSISRETDNTGTSQPRVSGCNLLLFSVFLIYA